MNERETIIRRILEIEDQHDVLLQEKEKLLETLWGEQADKSLLLEHPAGSGELLAVYVGCDNPSEVGQPHARFTFEYEAVEKV